MTLASSLPQRDALVMVLCNLGEILCQMGAGHAASEQLEQAHSIISAEPDGIEPCLIGAVSGHRGWAAMLQGDLATAERLLLDGLAHVRSADSKSQEKEMLGLLARVLELRGDQATADQLRQRI